MVRALSHPDTLYFEEKLLGDERSDREVELLTRLLDLEEGTEVLDAPCGWGRHANRLAARGCRVVGLDNDSLRLDRARKDAAGKAVEVDYVEGDLRELPFDGRFEAVLNWRTSFGFFDEEGNREQLHGFAPRAPTRRKARDGFAQPRRHRAPNAGPRGSHKRC